MDPIRDKIHVEGVGWCSLRDFIAIAKAANRATKRFFTPGASAVVVMGDLRRTLDVTEKKG